MNAVKKSFNLESDIAQRIDDFISKNPGVSATLIFNQAIKQWLTNPKVELNRAPATDDDVDRFLNENRELMGELAK